MDVPGILRRWSAIEARAVHPPTKAGEGKSRMALRVENAADKAEVYVYDVIGDWGVSAMDIVGELRAVGNVPIDLHINSEGGSVFDGLAIYNALASHSKPITAYIDALAASAASFIAMAASRIVIAKNASMMIHDAIGLAYGNAADMRALADLLDESSDTIAEIYDDHAGNGVAHWRGLMKAETWYRGQAAVDAGLADEVAAAPKAKNAAPQRIAAYKPVAQETADPPRPSIFEGLGAEFRESASFSPKPTIEELLNEQLRQGSLAAAIGRGDGG